MRYLTPLIVLCLTAALAAAPTTQPAAAPDVVVLPFTGVDAASAQDWIGAGIQQSLLADLAQLKSLQATAASARTTDLDQALQAARAVGAGYVIVGSYQLVDPQLRISGQVVDASSGRILGGLKATGPLRDLFALQDTLGTQAKRILNETLSPAPEAPPQAAQPAPAPTPSVVVNVQTAPQPPADRYTDAYHGSGLQRAVRKGPIDAYRRAYDDYSYYGSDFYDYWGFPPAVTYGVWPGYIYGGKRYHRPPVIIKPRPPVKFPEPTVIEPWQPPRAAGVPLVP